MYDSIVLFSFVFRIACHVGIIISIWTYDQTKARYRPGVGFVAFVIAAANAGLVLTAFKAVNVKGFDMFNPLITASIFFFYMGLLTLRGNVEIFARPIITVYDMGRRVWHAK